MNHCYAFGLWRKGVWKLASESFKRSSWRCIHEHINTFFKENNTSVQQGHIKLIKYDSKDFYNDFCFEIMPFVYFLFIKEPWNKCITVSRKTVFNMIIRRNVSYAPILNHIRMISEGSCDTKDWSMLPKIKLCITGINYILKYIPIEFS